VRPPRPSTIEQGSVQQVGVPMLCRPMNGVEMWSSK
jgi:hypothetical protein